MTAVSGLLKILAGPVIALAASVSLGGCAKYEAASMPSRIFGECSYRLSTRDVRIGIEPFEEDRECQSVFNKPNLYQKDILGEGFLPVYVRLLNQGDAGIILDPRGTRLVDSKGREWAYVSPQEAAAMKMNKEKKIRYTVAFAISPIGGAIGAAEVDRMSGERKKDYAKKSLQENVEVAPGGETEGFIFLKGPGEFNAGQEFIDSANNGKLFLYLEDKDSRREVVFELNRKKQ